MLHFGKRSKVILTQSIYHMLYPRFTALCDYSMHPHLPKQPVVIYSFLPTDDSLNYQSSSEIKRRNFQSTHKSSQQTEGTTVDPEGIPDDLKIISVILVLNGVAGQKCFLSSLKLLTLFKCGVFSKSVAYACVDER